MNNSPALLPEHVGCPQCGSISAKRWRSYSGVELCTDCEWDYFAELNGRKLLDAAQAVKTRRPGVGRSVALTASAWHVYRIDCEQEVVYIGTAQDVNARFREHFSGRGASVTKQFKPKKSSILARVATQEEAKQIEQVEVKTLVSQGVRAYGGGRTTVKVRDWCQQLQRPPDDIRTRKYKHTLDDLVTPGFNSICLICGRIFYGAAMSSCSRCGGRCRNATDHDMQLMGRHGQRLVEMGQ